MPVFDRITPEARTTALATRAGDLPPWLVPTVLARWALSIRDADMLDPIKSAYRRRLLPGHSRPMTQPSGLAGRVAEIPWRLWRQCWRWRRPRGRHPFTLHIDAGD
jgi:hypothetical protein